MNTILWVGQLYLAVTCLFSGISKSLFSRLKLIEQMKQTGVESLPLPLMRFIGISQLLGSVGLIFPWLLNVLPFLTPMAAFAFGMDVTMASGVHIRIREYKIAAVTFFTALVGFFVAAGRFDSLNIL
jgi:hypothetical protein